MDFKLLVKKFEMRKRGIKLNKHGNNKKIKGHIFSDTIMRMIGFYDYFCLENSIFKDFCNFWIFSKDIVVPKIIIPEGIPELCSEQLIFRLLIYKDTEEIKICVYNDSYRYYDYQAILDKFLNSEYELYIKEEVEKIMQYLQDSGVISGHKYGEYI